MKSKVVPLASALVLLITASATFADNASRNNTKAEKATEAPAKSPKEAAKPAKKVYEKEKGNKGSEVPAAIAPVPTPNEYRADPCLVDNLPGC